LRSASPANRFRDATPVEVIRMSETGRNERGQRLSQGEFAALVERNGQTTVVTGWRAWLLAATLFIGLTLVMAVVAFVFLGAAITVGAVLLIVVPVAIGVALIASLFRARPR
jgi:hypothetical protein